MKNNNILETLIIKYKPLFVGTKKSNLNFYNTNPDLDFLLDSKHKKIFVTDTTIFNLELLKPFFGKFSKIADKKTGGTDYSVYSYDKHGLVVIPQGEAFKTMDSVLSIVKTGLDFNLTRKDNFTAIGGGVLTDITAFAASIYKRGACCEFVPTTLLAMVDAAIGGKTGCDFDDYKNVVGAFFPAKALYIYPVLIQSLPEKEFISGFAEAIKTALLFDKKCYEYMKANKDKILKRDPETLYKIITFCAKAKAKIVEKDLSEKNIRMLLNLGHTFGHALESRAGLGVLTHGECVAWGISRSVKASLLLGLCSEEYYNDVINTLKSFGYETSAVHPAFSDSKEILKTMHNDKKNSSSNVRVILQKGICKNVITETTEDIILNALK